MTEPIEMSRFEALLDAYGAEPRRWPEAERSAALALVRADPAAAALLERAGAIDDLLGDYRVPAPSAALVAAVTRRPFVTRARLWWSALLLGVAGITGALAGSAATAALALEPVSLPALYGHATAFGDVSANGEEGE